MGKINVLSIKNEGIKKNTTIRDMAYGDIAQIMKEGSPIDKIFIMKNFVAGKCVVVSFTGGYVDLNDHYDLPVKIFPIGTTLEIHIQKG